MKLGEWRAAAGLSLGLLARRVGLETDNANMVMRWERGDAIPRRESMLRLFVLTGGQVTPNDFYDLPPLDALPEQVAA